MRRVLQSVAVPGLLLLAGVCGMGCDSGPKDGWYDYSADVERRKKEYVGVQMQYGMTEVEASRAWGLQYSIEQTHHSEPAVREGNDMEQVVEFPRP